MMNLNRDDVFTLHKHVRWNVEREDGIAIISRVGGRKRSIANDAGRHVVAHHLDAIDVDHDAVIAPQLHDPVDVVGRIAQQKFLPKVGCHIFVAGIRPIAHGRADGVAITQRRRTKRPGGSIKGQCLP